MKNDIENRTGIELMVNTFYDKVKRDEKLGPLFNEVMGDQWNRHLEKMYDFWENILFQAGNYAGNPMATHLQLHQSHPLTAALFNRWKELFLETVNGLFAGPHAETVCQRAISMAAVMQIKIHQSGEGRPVY